MPREKNCSLVHKGTDPGPCISCGKDDITHRYIHLVQKQQSAANLYSFVKQFYPLFKDTDCICRKCETKLLREFTKTQDHETLEIDEASPAKKQDLKSQPAVLLENEDTHDQDKELCFLSAHEKCVQDADHTTSVNISSFQSCFKITINEQHILPELEYVTVSLCHLHYGQFKNFESSSECGICEKSTTGKKTVSVSNRLDMLNIFIKDELQMEKCIEIENAALCMTCYTAFNRFTRLDGSDLVAAKTGQYLTDRLKEYHDEEPDFSNIDTYCFKIILKHVVENFLQYKPILLPQLYSEFKVQIDKAMKDFDISFSNSSQFGKIQHNANWLYRMLKSTLGPALQVYVPNRKQGRMLYRLGTDLLQCLHSLLTNSQKEVEDLKICNQTIQKKVQTVISDSSGNETQCLDDALKVLKVHVKSYVKDAIESDLQEIHSFSLKEEIKKINPSLWNFIYKLTSNEEEAKIMKRSSFDWNDHYIIESANENNLENCRMFRRLYIASCIFNTNSSQCVQPLHLLCTDIHDKYSGSSTELLKINARLGAGVAKETLRRFIANKSLQMSTEASVTSESFAIASFDNLDKNQSYALVGLGKDKSGFHGTTIQSVLPKPSITNCADEVLTSEEFSQNNNDPKVQDKQFKKTNQRTVPSQLVKSINEPDDRIGCPSAIRINKFKDLNLEDFNVSDAEENEWNIFERCLTSYNFLKHFLNENHIIIPGLKAYLSSTNESTEKSQFSSVAVLNDPADCKETVLKTLNILHDKFNIGQYLQHLVVVGDGKSYDHLIRLKSEYGSALDWVLPYPGDWHTLKNILPIFMKIYYDAGLKELATKYHHGATLKVLTECSKFSVTNRFFVHVWEALFRYQICAFVKHRDIAYLNEEFWEILDTAISTCN